MQYQERSINGSYDGCGMFERLKIYFIYTRCQVEDERVETTPLLLMVGCSLMTEI
jgi:hypothetical protein